MIVKCQKCNRYFDDEFRTTICPHNAFSANDGNNNFEVHQFDMIDEGLSDHIMLVTDLRLKK